MPTAKIPLLSDQGIWKDGDSTITTPQYPYFLNGYFEKIDAVGQDPRYIYVKRPGLSTVVTAAFNSGTTIRGMSAMPDRRSLLIITSSFTDGVRGWTYSSSGTLTDRGLLPGGAWFTDRCPMITPLDGISYGSSNYWVISDKTSFTLSDNNGTFTQITDADLTGLTVLTNFAALDGYLFVGDNRNRIYNSDLNTPTTWQALSFLTASDYPGQMMWLSRIKNYLIAFKQNSIEFFEDVGNPTPGSPLESRKQLNRAIGLASTSSIQEVSDGIIFAGRTGKSTIFRMYKIDKNTLGISEISNRYVNQCLDNVIVDTTSFAYAYSTDTVYHSTPSASTVQGQSQVFNMNGKEFYTITLAPPDDQTKRFTHVYDNEMKIWTCWATSVGTTLVNDVYGFIGSNATKYIMTRATFFADNTTNPPTIRSFKDDSPVWQDGTTKNYLFQWTSQEMDFGSLKRKFMDSLEVWYDSRNDGTPSASGADGSFTLKYRDFDYSNTSGFTVSRTLYFDSDVGARAIIRRLGSFRKRNFFLQFAGNYPMRIWNLEARYNMGETDQEG